MIYFLILFEIFYLLMSISKILGQDLLSPIDFSLNDLLNTENNQNLPIELGRTRI